MDEINSKEDYDKYFKNNVITEKTIRHEAYKCALEIRKFEIGLYWERAKYFWALIVSTFAAYFSLSTATNKSPGLIFLVSCIGYILSLAWFLVNRGSKYWQENWESHVDALEDEFVGPLYKTTKSNSEFDICNPYEGFPYSVSKVNQIISLFIVIVWIGLIIKSISTTYVKNNYSYAMYWMTGIMTVLFTIFLLFCRGGSEGKDRSIKFKISNISEFERSDR